MAEPEHRSLTPEAVAEWLAANADFLVERPELAERLELPSDDGAVSLTEFRSRRLIDENTRLRRQLGQLGEIAGENEQLMRRLHVLTLALTAAPDMAALFDELSRRLREDFSAEVLSIRLPNEAGLAVEGARIEAWSGDAPDWLQPLLESGSPECGRLTRAKREWLFEDSADEVGSAALVPIGRDGLLAIGAAADDRFQPGMGTLFLELLGETLAQRLRALAADGEHRRRA